MVVVICSRAPTGHVHRHTIYVHIWCAVQQGTLLRICYHALSTCAKYVKVRNKRTERN